MDAALVLEGCPIHPSIDYFFRCKRVTLSLTLKERVMHIWLLCCRSRFCYCRSRFRSKRVTSSLTLKERALSLTLKERVLHICLLGSRSRFRSKRVTLSLTLKERVMHIWLLCCRLLTLSLHKWIILSLTLNKERVIHIGFFVVAHA